MHVWLNIILKKLIFFGNFKKIVIKIKGYFFVNNFEQIVFQ